MNITRFYHEWKESERKNRIGNIWVFSWLSIVILGSLSIFLFGIINPFVFPEVPFYPYIYLGLISTIIDNFSIIPFTTIRIKQIPKLFASVRIYAFVLQTSLNLMYVVVLNKGIAGFFISNIIFSTLMIVVYVIIMRNWAQLNFEKRYLAESLKFSLPLIPSQMLGSFTVLLDRYLLQRFVNVESLGIYSICLKFTNLIGVLHSSLKMSYVPFAFKTLTSQNTEGKLVVSRMIGFYIFPIFFAGAIIALFSGDFIHWVNQPNYFPAIPYISYLVGTAIITALPVYYTLGILMSKKTGLTVFPTAVQLLFMVVTCFLLIPPFQLYGLIISKFISSLAFFIISIIISSRVYKIFYNWSQLILFFVASACIFTLSQVCEGVLFSINIAVDLILMVVFVLFFSVILRIPLSIHKLQQFIGHNNSE
jgi:O-antigen/teichoic acid export membrane protein